MEYATPATNWVQYNVHSVNPPSQRTYSTSYSSHVPGNAFAGGTHDCAQSIEPGLTTDPSKAESSVALTSHTIGQLDMEPQFGIHYNNLNMVVDARCFPGAYGYYWNPNSQNWTAAQTVTQYQANPVGYGFMLSEHSAQVVSISANGPEHLGLWVNPTFLPRGKGLRFQQQKKKATKKIVEAVFCEVCKINCNSNDILVQHKQGKKHKKKLEKLRQSLGPPPLAATTVSNNPTIQPVAQANIGQPASVSSNPTSQPVEQPNTGQPTNARNKKKKKASGTEKDLENKRRKVIEGGAAAESVRTCTVCNVVCNSETVFNSHLLGQMHAAKVQKLASQNK